MHWAGFTAPYCVLRSAFRQCIQCPKINAVYTRSTLQSVFCLLEAANAIAGMLVIDALAEGIRCIYDGSNASSPNQHVKNVEKSLRRWKL